MCMIDVPAILWMVLKMDFVKAECGRVEKTSYIQELELCTSQLQASISEDKYNAIVLASLWPNRLNGMHTS